MRRIEKILLIFPPGRADPMFKIERTNPPLGLMYLAAVIEKEFEVKILDAVVEGFEKRVYHNKCRFDYGLDYNEIKSFIYNFSPELIGVSCLFTEERLHAHSICRIAKEINSEIITVMGGVHPTATPYEVMKDKNIDYIIMGEGEYSFRELLNRLNNNKDISEIDGIVYRNANNIKINPKKSFIHNLDELPFPARHKVPLLKYSEFAEKGIRYPSKGYPYTTLLSSRGCPAKCIFCSSSIMYGPRLRTRSAGNVLAEIEVLVNKWGIKELDFFDDNLTFDRKRALEIFQGMIDRKYNLYWTAGNGLAIYALDEELLEKMKECGCYRLHLAVESGDQEVLTKIIRKPLDLKRVKPIIKKAKELDMETVGFFIIGFPGETMNSIRKTVALAEELDFDYITFQIAAPHPGTKLFKICEESNLFISEFTLDNLSTSKGNIVTDAFTPRQLEEIRVMEWDRINFKTEEKCQKLCQMMGVTSQELEKKRIETRKRLNQ